MARGPKPKPAAIKSQRGSSRRPIGEDAPSPAGAVVGVEPPEWLKAEALKVWNRHAGDLVGQKLLTPRDATAFARYCRNLADWVAYKETLDQKGHTYEIETASGQVVRARPEFAMAERLERMLLAIEDRFGLNPAERQRIFAARAAGTGSPGDLFGGQGAAQAREGDPAAQAAEPAKPIDGPIGLLN